MVPPSNSLSDPEGKRPDDGLHSDSLTKSMAGENRPEVRLGDAGLETKLETITNSAQQLTGASGAALAMWKDGAMVCRARSGDAAPPLGARLSSETGISGECFRTGRIQNCSEAETDPRVDAEVCRGLGLRSIVVLPIQVLPNQVVSVSPNDGAATGVQGGISGILEVFSDRPAAFSEQHIALLEQLAAWAEQARVAEAGTALPVAPRSVIPVPVADAAPITIAAQAASTPQIEVAAPAAVPGGLLPASDRVGDVALALTTSRRRPFILGAVGLAAISLLALAIWLGWRGAGDTDGKARAAAAVSVAENRNTTTNGGATSGSGEKPVDKAQIGEIQVGGANGGEANAVSSGKPSAGAPVELASKVDVLVGKPSAVKKSTTVAEIAPVKHDVQASQTGLRNLPVRKALPPEARTPDPPSIGGGAGGSSAVAVNEVLLAKMSLPGLSHPVSQGVSGGELLHRVAPIYPTQARMIRLEGSVILSAIVAKDGKVSEVKVVEGSPVLAGAAVEAVKQWRYKPFELDGQPVSNEIRIAVSFKIPSSSASR